MTEGKTENRKGKEGLPQMGPTHRGSPAQGQGRLLPRARQAAAAVASMPTCLATSCFPRATSRRLETPRSFPTPFPPPHCLPLPLSPDSATPEKNVGARTCAHATIEPLGPCNLVQEPCRLRLRHQAKG